MEGLSQKGIQLFVLSSKKTDVLYRNLQSLQLDKYFTDWIGSDQVTYYKPHPDGIHTIMKRYGQQPHACIMIGDAIFDIEMGHAAGCHTCAVAWGSHSVTSLQQAKPTYLVKETRELLTL